MYNQLVTYTCIIYVEFFKSATTKIYGNRFSKQRWLKNYRYPLTNMYCNVCTKTCINCSISKYHREWNIYMFVMGTIYS